MDGQETFNFLHHNMWTRFGRSSEMVKQLVVEHNMGESTNSSRCRGCSRVIGPSAPICPLVSLHGAPVSDDQGRSTRRQIARRPIMTADVLCDEGVVKQSARVQLRGRSIFPAAGDGGGKTML